MRWILIDQLIECEPGKRAVGLKAFTRSEMFFMDHFPDRALVPGVLQIEMVAQTAGKCIKIAHPYLLPVLAKVHSARFIRPIEPGDQCRIVTEIKKLSESYALEAGTIEVAGKRVAEVELMVALTPRDYPPVDPVIEDWKKRQGALYERDSMETRSAALIG